MNTFIAAIVLSEHILWLTRFQIVVNVMLFLNTFFVKWFLNDNYYTLTWLV